jgi:hypothetical protein
LWAGAFVVTFLIATYAVSELTTFAPRALQGTSSLVDVVVAAACLLVAVLSTMFLSRMIYASELAAGRVRRRVRVFE